MSYFWGNRIPQERRVIAPRVESYFQGLDTALYPMSRPIDRDMRVLGLSLVTYPEVEAMGAYEAHGGPWLSERGGTVDPYLWS